MLNWIYKLFSSSPDASYGRFLSFLTFLIFILLIVLTSFKIISVSEMILNKLLLLIGSSYGGGKILDIMKLFSSSSTDPSTPSNTPSA